MSKQKLDDKINTDNKAANYWKAMESYNKAEKLLLERLKTEGSARILLQLGSLQILMDNHVEAERNLLSALSKDPNLIKAHDALSIIYLKRKDYKNAVSHLENAIKFDPEDLELRSRLALAYLKAEIIDKAETNFKKILKITPFHIDSQIGLGEVYTYMGDLGEEEMYELAIEHFTLAIKNAMSEHSSRRLNKSELAQVFYLRGYCRIRYYEAQRHVSHINKEETLQTALSDFTNCLERDPEHGRSKIALKKIKMRHFNMPLIKRAVSIIAFVFCGLIFFTALCGYFIGYPQPLNIGYFTLLTFGASIFAIMAIYLPWIFKIAAKNIELKKDTFVRADRVGIFSEGVF